MMIPLWERMSHIYGHRWTSAFGISAMTDEGKLADVAKTWFSALSDLTKDQLGKGVRESCNASGDYWPTLPGFKAMCLGRSKNAHGLDYTPAYLRKTNVAAPKKLPGNPCRSSFAVSSLAEMRKVLQGH